VVKLNKIYTRTGDDGTTGLVDGSRLSKADLRMEAIGDVDEANSAIGAALAAIDDPEARAMLGRIQNELFDLGADLATPGEDFTPDEMTLRIVAEQVERLEREIDRMTSRLAPLTSFILPGGQEGAAHVHLARAIVRRAERAAVGAAATTELNPLALAYINRLSDHLFVLARMLNDAGRADILWQPGATRSGSHEED
jgi:cob(I)alamin adenosyltransferase